MPFVVLSYIFLFVNPDTFFVGNELWESIFLSYTSTIKPVGSSQLLMLGFYSFPIISSWPNASGTTINLMAIWK